jgi:CubicO group peptidase (beta-lactamase class C family)
MQLMTWFTKPRVMATLLALALLLAAAPVVAQPAPTAAPDVAAIDSYIADEMRAQPIPGMALGIVQGDQIVYLKGFGVADPSGRAITPQTPFPIGKLSKAFTALAVMLLVEAGKIELDTPVQRYIPWFHVADAAASAQITVRHLLNQIRGLSHAAGAVSSRWSGRLCAPCWRTPRSANPPRRALSSR